MSYVFDVDGKTVWSPSLRVGELYVRMLRDVGAVLGAPTGLNALSADMWDIDIDAFEELIKIMYETYFASGHQAFKALIGGVLAPSIVILERGGKEIRPDTDEEREFYGRALGLSMAC
ncbi:DUF6086 family protein [Nocardia sp. NPDC050175]|uniref:DUF6086 family protein n=1 Tax=Nocardia sp. NPDC050175 TaxID=3364317 RepID=UPI00379880A2